ncbi:hypothetical protein C8Q80DRAFT_1106635 [Daedaleopsis nitida]|nr:hypothetical protein C8Q80DRAFT_1106635 [Daedaleopsis nitida]
MERIHTDIWLDIFQIACTDGGSTGAALAIASRGLRATSAPCRFHSVKLHSLAQIGQFLLCLERVRRSSIDSPPRHSDARAPTPRLGGDPDVGPQTQHLLLSFLPDTCDAPLRPWRSWSEYSRKKAKRHEQVEEGQRAWEASKAAWDRQCVYLLPRLFALAAPTLKTLTVLQCSEIVLPAVQAVVFPVLRELTLLADDRIFVDPAPVLERGAATSRTSTTASDCAAFPSLTHLHVVYEGPKTHPWEKTLPLWGELAPSVTHLRVSQASKLIPEVLRTISAARHPHAGPSTSNSGTVSFPNLRRAIVQPFVVEPVRGHAHIEEVHARRRAPRARSGPEIVLLRGRWYRDGYWRDRLRWEWEGRMVGGQGCWSEREEDEGEWAFERRKKAEVTALRSKKTQQMTTHSLEGRSSSMIRLSRDEGGPYKWTRWAWSALLARKRSLSV